MAGADGRQDTPLKALLKREPYRFDFHQAVRLLEQMAQHERAQPDAVALGVGSDPRREAVRLRGSLSSSFPASDIESLTSLPEDGGDRPALTVTFLGIGGPFGPLPPPLTAHVIERRQRRDHAARDFLDVFNHRLLALLARQSRLFRPALQMAPVSVPGSDIPARTPLLALLGLPSASAEARLRSIATSLLGAAGLLNQRPVSAHALERLLGAHFGVRVGVMPLCGGWLTLADDQHTRLGRSGRLGRDAMLGGRVWDQAAGIRLEIGPMGLGTLQSLLPGGSRHDELAGLVTFALGDAFDVELHLSLLPREVPPGSLGSAKPRLGWTSWLGQQPHSRSGTVRLRLGPTEGR